MVNIASCYLQLDKIAEAKMTLLKSLRIEAHNEEIYFLLGEAYAKSGSLQCHQCLPQSHRHRWQSRRVFPFFGKSVCAGRRLQQSKPSTSTKQQKYVWRIRSTGENMHVLWFAWVCTMKHPNIGRSRRAYFGADLFYCRAITLFFMKRKKEGPGNTYRSPRRGFRNALHHLWTRPELEVDKDINSMIRYIKENLETINHFAKHYSILIDGGWFYHLLFYPKVIVMFVMQIEFRWKRFILPWSRARTGWAGILSQKIMQASILPSKTGCQRSFIIATWQVKTAQLVLKFLYLPPTLQVHDLCASAPITLSLWAPDQDKVYAFTRWRRWLVAEKNMWFTAVATCPTV